MTEKQFTKVMSTAVDIRYEQFNENEQQEAFRILSGCGLPGVKCTCTYKQAAYLLNWQALLFDGTYDMQAIEDLKEAYMINVKIKENDVDGTF